MPVLSKIKQENDDVNWSDELDSLFASLSIPNSAPLPTKFHAFVDNVFTAQGFQSKVPTLAWFAGVVPPSDPHGIAHYALIRLQDLALEYQPGDAPVEEHVYLLLIRACAVYWESGAHDAGAGVECGGSVLKSGRDQGVQRKKEEEEKCEVCRLEERLVEAMDRDAVLKAWAAAEEEGGLGLEHEQGGEVRASSGLLSPTLMSPGLASF